jgi:type VI secretion system protein ImpE
MSPIAAEELVKQGRVDEALVALQDAVRAEPAVARHRVFLFQLLSVLGRWDRAMTQLNVAAEIEPANLLMAQVCRAALNAEALRAEVFAGKRLPMFFGEPKPWAARMVQALGLTAAGKHADAAGLRAGALEEAPAVGGMLNDAPFEWLADADSRMGPMLETVIDGKYLWVPMENVARLQIDKPVDLRDLVWATCTFTWTNGGTAVGLLFARYPGSETNPDPALRLGRKTDWTNVGAETYVGAGQRTLATDAGEYPMLEVRSIIFTPAESKAEG